MRPKYPQLFESVDIIRRQIELARDSYKVDIVSYNVHVSGRHLLNLCPRTRLIVGVPAEVGERQATIGSKIVRVATAMPKVMVRLLPECHVKMAIFHAGKRPFSAIVGSCNLGTGHYHELSVELRGERELAHCFELFQRLWSKAQQVKPLDLRATAKSLAGQVFEVPSAST